MNMSSAIARIPSSAFTLYGASKSFIHYFSQTFSYEYEDKGVTVQGKPFCLCLVKEGSQKMRFNADRQRAP